MIQLTANANAIEVWWVIVSIFGLMYSWILRRDAGLDVAARASARLVTGVEINVGVEDLARLLVTTALILVSVFLIFLAVGVQALFVPSPAVTTPVSYILQLELVAAQHLLAFMAFYKQRVRRRVLTRDMESDAVRKIAAAALLSSDMQANTEAQHKVAAALRENTNAARLVAHELVNGPLAASLANTIALDRNTASHKTSVDPALQANTDAVGQNTRATDANTDARREDEQP